MNKLYGLKDIQFDNKFNTKCWNIIQEIRRNEDCAKITGFIKILMEKFNSEFVGVIYPANEDEIKKILCYPKKYNKILNKIIKIKKYINRLIDIDLSIDNNFYYQTNFKKNNKNIFNEIHSFKIPYLRQKEKSPGCYFILLVNCPSTIPSPFEGPYYYYLDQISSIINIWTWKIFYDANVLYEIYSNQIEISYKNHEINYNENMLNSLWDKIKVCEISKNTLSIINHKDNIMENKSNYNQYIQHRQEILKHFAYWNNLSNISLNNIEEIRKNKDKMNETKEDLKKLLKTVNNHLKYY
jgi:hypothetical protein